jgi:hypothetical protein
MRKSIRLIQLEESIELLEKLLADENHQHKAVYRKNLDYAIKDRDSELKRLGQK